MNKFDRQHAIYERQFFQKLIKFFRQIANAITFGLITEENAQTIIETIFLQNKLKDILFNTQIEIGNSYGAKVGRVINRSFKKEGFKYPLFSEKFQIDLINYYDKYGGENIKILTETYTKSVVAEIRKGTELNETVTQMQSRISKAVNSPKFYKYQALRIARTETTFAMNKAKEVTGEVSGFLMEKVWITRVDGRERISHAELNNKVIPQNDSFDVGGYKMKFPGDRNSNAPASEVVNCRCSFGYRGKKDANGDYIYIDI